MQKSRPKQLKVAIIGGSIAGLGMALLLARRGYRVVVHERDCRPPVAGPDEAFSTWDRQGVPQFRHSHIFLARLTMLMRERFPDLLSLLRTAGAIEIPLTMAAPPELELGPRQKGDGELVLLAYRRAALEWALLTAVRREPRIEIREGVLVTGLIGEAPKPATGEPAHIRGLRFRELAASPSEAPEKAGIRWRTHATAAATGPEKTTRAAIVIDASGRRAVTADWLVDLGAPPPEVETIPTGIFYFTRFYRLIGPPPRGLSTGLVGGDMGWIKLATFPGDNGTFSITVGTGIEDQPLKKLSEPAVFEAMLAAFPSIAPWREPRVSQPLDGPSTPVLVMGGLKNVARRFGNTRPSGFFALGDALCHSNPIYGRGVTSALLSATLLDDALAAFPNDDRGAGRAYAKSIADEVEPFWDAAARADRFGAEARRQRNAVAEGADDSLLSRLLSPLEEARKTLVWLGGMFFEKGLEPAMRSDAQIYRTVMRVMNMLDDPRTSLFTPEFLLGVLPHFAESLLTGRKRTGFAGPSRAEGLAIVEQNATPTGKRKASARRYRPESAPRAVEAAVPQPLRASASVRPIRLA